MQSVPFKVSLLDQKVYGSVPLSPDMDCIQVTFYAKYHSYCVHSLYNYLSYKICTFAYEDNEVRVHGLALHLKFHNKPWMPFHCI